jgi:hypothetical protein
MTITLFVNPDCLSRFIEITKKLKSLDIDNNYAFNPIDIQFTEFMISNWIIIQMHIDEYLKLKSSIQLNTHKKF